MVNLEDRAESRCEWGTDHFVESGNPFFILGCGRSGTSLLARMLNEHSNLAVPYESHLFNNFYPWLKWYGDLSREKNRVRLVDDILATDVMNDWRPRLDQEDVLHRIGRHDFGGIVAATMSSWASAQGKKRWGEKTPGHAWFWDEIQSFFPNAKIIHVVRDGRDVALSFMNARFGPKTIYSAGKYWVNYVKRIDQIKTKIDPGNFHQLYYEELLDKPISVLNEVCDFLGESFEPQMLDFHKNKARYPTDNQNLQNLKRPLQKNNKRKWSTMMSRRNLRVFEGVAYCSLKKHGYELSHRHPEISLLEKLYREYVEKFPPKAWAMLKNKKGHKDALIRLRIRTRLILWDKLFYETN